MQSPAARRAPSAARRSDAQPRRMAFLGARTWLEGAAPPEPAAALFDTGPEGARADEALLARVRAHAPSVCVVFGPSQLPPELLGELPGVVLGVLLDASLPAEPLPGVERLISFFPALTGAPLAGGKEIWRAVAPPVSDAMYAPVHPLRGPPRAISIGRSTRHREHVLTPSKHHHDLLQVIHGVSGAALRELLLSHDVGVHVAPEPGGGHGQQVGLHLAAGQLLISDELAPAHGLECDIDYLRFDSPEGLVWMLERLASFPEMHWRVRVRGRMKAEQYRASRVFARLAHDLLADVAAFG
jgi:hypothetical protein